MIGAKGLIDKDIFYSKTMPVLLLQMETQRKMWLVNIRTKLKENIDIYPLSEALMDVEEYYKAWEYTRCTTEHYGAGRCSRAERPQKP